MIYLHFYNLHSEYLADTNRQSIISNTVTVSYCEKENEMHIDTNTDIFNGHDAVDLGLTADNGNHLLFATCNVGANSPEEYGDYFMWGSVTPNNTDKCYWDDTNLPYHTGTSLSTGWTKYIPTGNESYGTPDDKAVLESEDDAAHVIMGGNWRIPTTTEFQRLRTLTSTWTTENGVNGRKWTSGNYTLFIPAVGYRSNGSFALQGNSGFICSSSLNTSSPHLAYYLYFNKTSISDVAGRLRCNGFSVRGVIELTEEQYQAWLSNSK